MTTTDNPHMIDWPIRHARPASDLYALPTVVSLRTALQFLGISEETAYALARTGKFPVPLLRVGKQYRITRASMLAVLDPYGYADPTRVAERPGLTAEEEAAASRVRALPPNVQPGPEDLATIMTALDRLTTR